MRRTLVLAALTLCACALAAPQWHHPLYLGNGGVWRQRIAVEVRNGSDAALKGDQAFVRVGTGAGEAALAGAEARALRVCDAAGNEMLFALLGPNQELLRRGAIPAGSVLSLPVECAARATATYYIYFDNPDAWEVPDFLDTVGGLRNGGLEAGSEDTPAGWNHDANDESHRTFWVKERPHGGQWCLKTVVRDGAEPTWIATRQSGIRIVGGAKYVFTAWVRAENVRGSAGWYVHVGNSANNMIISPMAIAGEGTFDWRQVRAEFTAPAEATRADLGTVLRGTGTAWFDDVTLLTAAAEPLPALASAPERLRLTEDGVSPSCGGVKWDYRLPVRVTNLSEEARNGLVTVDVGGLLGRLQGRVNTEALTLVFKGQVVPHSRLGDQVLFEAQLPPRSLRTYYLCAARSEAIVQTDLKTQYQALLASPRNLVRNPDFELGARVPDEWPGGAEGERPAGAVLRVDQPGLFGQHCARLEVPATSAKAWTGWRQNVPVQAGHTYLYAAWVKCADLEGGVQLHAHRRDAKGEICKTGGYTSAGPAIGGNTDWTLISGQFEMPEDCTTFQVHLTMLATGTAWHDGVVVMEVSGAEAGTLEGHPPAALTVWPVNPVVKVFREDVPPPQVPAATLSAGRNEYEPLQLAVRSPQAVGEVQVTAQAPAGPGGARLPAPQVGVVGYVPMDHASSYYSTESPDYVRKYPRGGGGSDGFPGYWPDPILPRDRFELVANQTQPLWLTFQVPTAAAAGEYRGQVTLTAAGRTIAQVPYTLRVRNFILPEQGHLKAIYDVRQGSAIWGVPGKDLTQVRQDFWKFMADRRVCPDRVSPDPILRYENGQVTSDFTNYDRACSYYFDVLKLPHSYTPGMFYCFGWGFPPSEKFGEKPYEGTYPYEGADRGKLRPQFKQAYQACLRAYWEHMKQKGWADKVALYISDEPFDAKPEIRAQMKALCDMIHEVDPKIPVYCSNWHEQAEWEGYLNVWGVGHYGCFSVEKMRTLKQRGDTIWYTTDGQMCTDTPYCGVERLLPHYAFKYGAEAYEFWGIDWLTYNPYDWGWHSYIHQSDQPGKSYFVRYPNGDGFLAYPGKPIGYPGAVTSVRLEQAREGMEDYEYLWLLRHTLRNATQQTATTAAAEAALAAADKLVAIPNAGGRYSTKILPDPEAVVRVREQAGAALEALLAK